MYRARTALTRVLNVKYPFSRVLSHMRVQRSIHYGGVGGRRTILSAVTSLSLSSYLLSSPLHTETTDSSSFDPKNYIFAAIFAGIVGLIAYLPTRWKVCPPNAMLVVQGLIGGPSKYAKMYTSGSGTFVWPLIQHHNFLSKVPIMVEANITHGLSKRNLRVNVPTVFTIVISEKEELLPNAAMRLLDLERDQIHDLAQDIIFGQLRGVIASLTVEEINRDRERLVHKVKKRIEGELAKVGLELLNVTIKEITDEGGYLAALGRPAAAEAVQSSTVAEALQKKRGAIGVAFAEKERALRVAQHNRDSAVGIATQRMEEQVLTAEREAQKRIRVAQSQADAIVGENLAAIQMIESNANRKIREAELYRIGEIRRRQAEAEVRESQMRAEAKEWKARAEKAETEEKVEGVSPAKATKEQVLLDAEAKAQKIVMQAKAEADAWVQKKKAEADGLYEVMKTKADAVRMMVASTGGNVEEATRLMMVAKMQKLAEVGAEAVKNIRVEKVMVWDGGDFGEDLSEQSQRQEESKNKEGSGR